MSEREEMVARYLAGGESVASLARSHGISRKTAHVWISRAVAGEPLTDRSCRPYTSPQATSEDFKAAVVALWLQYPTWGGRKIHRALRAVGHEVPAPSTIQKIQERRRFPPIGHRRPAWTRFGADQRNDLWRRYFKGWHPLRYGRVYPLTMLDDHSRFLPDVKCVAQQTFAVVQPVLAAVFSHYVLHWEILCDNGSPWGSSHDRAPTCFEVWMMQLDIRVIHSRPYHSQTQGKLERLHRTFKADVFAGRTIVDLGDAQAAFSTFRTSYNLDRPHEALAHDPPVRHYLSSARVYLSILPAPVYPNDASLRKVSRRGTIRPGNRSHPISKALSGEYLGGNSYHN